MSDNEDNEVFCCRMEDHNDFFMKSLQEQFVDGRNCDLEIRLHDTKIYVHKCVIDIFFTKIGADIENDMFYIDMKEFPQTMVKPLIDMMYHGSLTVPLKRILDVKRTSTYIGFTQAQELMNQYADNLTAKVGSNKKDLLASTSTEVDGFVIKSEPPEDEVGDLGLLNTPGYIADNMSSVMSKSKSNQFTDPETPKNIYEVFTPNPMALDNNVCEVTSSLKFKENVGFSALIKDKDKTSVTVTDNPYETVCQIQRLNQMIIPRSATGSVKKKASVDDFVGLHTFGTKSTLQKTRLQFQKQTINADLKQAPPKNKNKSQNKSSFYGLNEKLEKSLSGRSVGVSVVHVNSPSLKPCKSTYDETNSKNFEEAAANRMLENSIVSMLASKSKKKSSAQGEVKELSIKARIKACIEDKNNRTVSKDAGTKTNSKRFPGYKYKQGNDDPIYSGAETNPVEKKIYATRKRPSTAVSTYTQHTDSSSDDDNESEEEIGEYLGKQKSKVKYFPPAGIVPEGCRSSYALSSFTKSRKITETIKNSKGDVMVIRKEIPVRRTMFNPKQNEQGVAAVVVCHPTKPVIRY